MVAVGRPEQSDTHYQDPAVCDMLLMEFGLRGPHFHIINGHVPVIMPSTITMTLNMTAKFLKKPETRMKVAGTDEGRELRARVDGNTPRDVESANLSLTYYAKSFMIILKNRLQVF